MSHNLHVFTSRSYDMKCSKLNLHVKMEESKDFGFLPDNDTRLTHE